jgi:hypothetical protein
MKDVINLYLERHKPVVGGVHLKDLKLSDYQIEQLEEVKLHLKIFEESTKVS